MTRPKTPPGYTPFLPTIHHNDQVDDDSLRLARKTIALRLHAYADTISALADTDPSCPHEPCVAISMVLEHTVGDLVTYCRAAKERFPNHWLLARLPRRIYLPVLPK